MKNSEDKLLSSVARDKQLGEVLSNGLKEMGTGECLGIEDIALLVEGNTSVNAAKREKMMKHLASCETCYEIFLLTADLQEEKVETEIKKEKRKVFLYKPLALAASLLIVIFSIYLFYKSGEIPKTTEQLVQVGKMKKENQIPAPVEEKRMVSKADVRDKIQKTAESPPPVHKSYTGKVKEKDSREVEASIAAGGQDFGRDIEPKKIERGGDAPGLERRREAKSLDEARDMEALRTKSPGAKRKSAQLPRSQRMPPPIEQEEDEGVQQQQDHKPAVVGSSGTLLWPQLDRLNRKSRNYKTHIPGKELQELFRETVQLTGKMRYAFAGSGKGAAESVAFSKTNNYSQRFAPLVTAISGENGIRPLPNMDFFLSKSEPGSICYRFFSLARWGWCDPEGFWHDAAVANRNLLQQWEELYPQLNGIFREIAGQTLKHLKQRHR